MKVVLSRRFFEILKKKLPVSIVGFIKTLLNRYVVIAPRNEKRTTQELDMYLPSPEQLHDKLLEMEKLLGSQQPKVSVIIPVYNNFEFTVRCVWSVIHQGECLSLQIIIIDDCSTDKTEEFFANEPLITYIRNEVNVGFLQSCNRAARKARAPFLYLLNNDTYVQKKAIDELYSTFSDYPDAGIVGSKLIYPNGVLQEAGGYVWRDASGANFGRGEDPADPAYNYVRDADYISGASIMLKADLWERLGGFDERFSPAYYEDTDLAMQVRTAGLRVIYQPFSQVIHFEGISCGTSLGGGVKAYQLVNQKKFHEKWIHILKYHAKNQILDPRDPVSGKRPRLLIIDTTVPEPDRDAGSVVAEWMNRIFIDLGYTITFIPTNLFLNGEYGQKLQRMGIEVLYSPYIDDIEKYLKKYARRYDLFFLCRYCDGGRFAAQLKKICSSTPIIFNTADLHHLRLLREAQLMTGVQKKIAVMNADIARQRELEVIEKVDQTILVSEYECEYVRSLRVKGNFNLVPLIMETVPHISSRSERSGIAFVGGFSHPPNVEAVKFFLADIWPKLHAKDPEIEFHIVGSNPPEFLCQNELPGVVVHGFVEDLNDFLNKRVMTVVPLTFGAGIKGKIGSSLAAGVPCVSTSIGAEGMGLENGVNILIEDEPDSFVAAILEVNRNDMLWDMLSVNGLEFVKQNYAPEIIKRKLQNILEKVAQPGVA